MRIPRGGGSFFKKCIFAKILGWGTKFGHLLYPPDFGQKFIFVDILTPVGVLEGARGGGAPPGRPPEILKFLNQGVVRYRRDHHT